MRPPEHRAFTLIEVLAALAILGIGMTILIRSQTQSLDNVRKVSNFERAVFTTENQLHWTFLDLNQADSWEEFQKVSVEDNKGMYRIEITLEPVEMERQGQVDMTILKITAVTTWREGNREQFFRLESNYFWGEEQQ